MSTTANSDGFTIGIAPDDAFDDIVFFEPTTCSRCFSLIRRHDTYRPDASEGVSKYAPEERLVRAHNGTNGYRTDGGDKYGYRPTHDSCTYCSECGAQSGCADEQDLPRRLAVQFASNLADRLHEAGVAIDTDELKRAVGHLKSKEALNGCDTEIFEAATTVAVRRERQRRR